MDDYTKQVLDVLSVGVTLKLVLLQLPFDGVLVEGSKIVSWAARDSSKPGRKTGSRWSLTHKVCSFSLSHRACNLGCMYLNKCLLVHHSHMISSEFEVASYT